MYDVEKKRYDVYPEVVVIVGYVTVSVYVYTYYMCMYIYFMHTRPRVQMRYICIYVYPYMIGVCYLVCGQVSSRKTRYDSFDVLSSVFVSSVSCQLCVTCVLRILSSVSAVLCHFVSPEMSDPYHLCSLICVTCVL